MSCLLKISNLYSELTEADKKISNYINANKKMVTKLSVSEFAINANVSTASIVRFSRKLGYDGFGELKIELAKDSMVEEKEYSYIDKEQDLSVKDIVSRISNKNTQIIQDTAVLNNDEEIQRVVQAIIDGKNIYIFGVGGSALIALDMQLKLIRINKTTFTSLDSHTQLTVSSNLQKDDVAIAISHSGNSKEVIKSMENAKDKGATCISITKYGENPLTKFCDLKLYVPSVENQLREGAISSRIAMLTLVDIIYIAMIQSDIEGAKDNLEKTRRIIDNLNDTNNKELCT